MLVVAMARISVLFLQAGMSKNPTSVDQENFKHFPMCDQI